MQFLTRKKQPSEMRNEVLNPAVAIDNITKRVGTFSGRTVERIYCHFT